MKCYSKIKLLNLPNSARRQIGLAWRKGSVHADEFRILGDLLSQLHKHP